MEANCHVNVAKHHLQSFVTITQTVMVQIEFESRQNWFLINTAFIFGQPRFLCKTQIPWWPKWKCFCIYKTVDRSLEKCFQAGRCDEDLLWKSILTKKFGISNRQRIQRKRSHRQWFKLYLTLQFFCSPRRALLRNEACSYHTFNSWW